MQIKPRKGDGKFILFCFLAFFGTIIVVNMAFLYAAMKTNSGVITENAYEKGLAYNETLSAVKAQPRLTEEMTYENGVLTWTLADMNGAPVTSGNASVFLVRPVMKGHDFTLPLTEIAPGVYEGRPRFPLPGLWTAKLDIKWNDTRYQTTQDLMAQ